GEGGELFACKHGEHELAAGELGETRVGTGERLRFEGDDDGVGGGEQLREIGLVSDAGGGGETRGGFAAFARAGDVGGCADLLGEQTADDGRGKITGAEKSYARRSHLNSA